jgi:hypothetical protein
VPRDLRHKASNQRVTSDSFGFQKIEQENLVAKTTFIDNFLSASAD